MPYILDANCFIDSKNRYYDFKFHPGFWDWLIQTNISGDIYSINSIKSELQKGDDYLSIWASTIGKPLFLKDRDSQTLSCMGDVSKWVNDKNNGYNPNAVNLFLSCADPWLISFAMAHGHTIVTHEIGRMRKSKIKIPDVCNHFGVKHNDLFKTISALDAKFVLG